MGGKGSGRKKGDKQRVGRNNSTFLTRSLVDINNEIKQAYVHITGRDKLWKTYNKVTPTEAEACFADHKGRCAYCDKALTYLGHVSVNSARLSWYVPLKVGGEARPDNLIVVCARCENDYNSTRKLRGDIVGLDSFADACEQLFIAVKEGRPQEERDNLKDRLNVKLSTVATCMRYVARPKWRPVVLEKMIEGENTIGERLEDMAKGKDTKYSITEDMKQMVTTKQYKILRGKDNGKNETKT
jgi:hypothetical protein